MTPEEEFYKLISTSFSDVQIHRTAEIVNEIKEQIKNENEVTSFFYNLCALFYNSAKSFENFKLNLANYSLPLDYTIQALKAQDERMAEMSLHAQDLEKTIKVFIENFNLDDIDRNDLVNALVNALLPEVIDLEDYGSLIARRKFFDEIKLVNDKLKEKQRFLRIRFYVNEVKMAEAEGSTAHYTLNSMMKFILYQGTHQHEDLETLNNKNSWHAKRMALKTCMILVHFGILNKTSTGGRHILMNKNGKRVLIETKVACHIYDLLRELDSSFDKDEKKANNTFNNKDKCDKIKNHLLREGQKTGKWDSCFSYEDINTKPWYFNSPDINS